MILLDHAFRLNSDDFRVVVFVEVLGCAEALVLMLVGLCLADVLLLTKYLMVFLLVGLVLIYQDVHPAILVPLFLVLFRRRLPQKLIGVLLDGHYLLAPVLVDSCLTLQELALL